MSQSRVLIVVWGEVSGAGHWGLPKILRVLGEVWPFLGVCLRRELWRVGQQRGEQGSEES